MLWIFFPLWILILKNGSQYFKAFKVWAVRGIMSSNGECSHLYNPPKPQVPIHFDSLTLEKECGFADTRTTCVLSTLLEFHLKLQWALEKNHCWHFSLESLFTWRVFCWDRIELPFVSSEHCLRCLHQCVLEALLEKSALKYSSQKIKIPNLHAVCLFKCTEISHFCRWASACFRGAFTAGKAELLCASSCWALTGADTARAASSSVSQVPSSCSLSQPLTWAGFRTSFLRQTLSCGDIKQNSRGELLFYLSISGGFSSTDTEHLWFVLCSQLISLPLPEPVSC